MELVLAALLVLVCVIYILGSVLAIQILRATLKVEKLAKSYGLDYNIRNKTLMYIVCILFSWLAYSALCNLKGKSQDSEHKDG